MDIDAEATRVREQLLVGQNGAGADQYVTLPEYPLEVWPEDLAIYFDACAKCVGAPVAMAAVPAASILAGVVGNSRPIIRKAGYPIPPAIWTFDLAEPGTGKSPMLGHARALVTKRQREEKQNHDFLQQEYELAVATRGRNDGNPPPEKPEPFQHYYTDNATIEALGPICEYSAGITMIRDELVGWLNDLNVYRSGKGSDRQAWLTFWSGQAGAKTDRKSSGVVMPENAVVCITGSIQPMRFAELAHESAKDGLLARFLGSIHPDIVVRDNDYTIEAEQLERARSYCGPLRRAGYVDAVTFSNRAGRLYREWDEENAELTQHSTGPARHFLSKLPSHLLKLTALLHCLHDPGATSKEVTHDRLSDAIELLEYHRAHTQHAYSLIQIPVTPVLVGLPGRIMRAIERMGGKATRTQVNRRLGSGEKSNDLSAGFTYLMEHDLIELTIEETGGRSAEAYEIKKHSM